MGERMLRTGREIAKEIHVWAGRKDPVPENRRVWSDPRHKQPEFRGADGKAPGTGAGAWPHPATALGRDARGAVGAVGTALGTGRYGPGGGAVRLEGAGEGAAAAGMGPGNGTAQAGPGRRTGGTGQADRRDRADGQADGQAGGSVPVPGKWFWASPPFDTIAA